MAWTVFPAVLNLALDGIQEADEFLDGDGAAGHVVADDRSVEDVHGREQSGRPVPLVVMGHSSGAAPLHRQAGLSTIEGLDLALFVDAEHHGVGRRIDIETDHAAQSLSDELGVVRQLELAHAMRLKPMRPPDALH